MAELGALALRFALPVALLGLGAGVYAGSARRPEWTRVAERALWTVFGLVTLAMLALFVAFASFDFQLRYVVANSARDMALHYRLAALWGGQAGSLLLWLWLLVPGFISKYWFPYIPLFVLMVAYMTLARMRCPALVVPHLRFGRFAMALFFFLLPVLILWGDVTWFVHAVLIIGTVSNIQLSVAITQRVKALGT